MSDERWLCVCAVEGTDVLVAEDVCIAALPGPVSPIDSHQAQIQQLLQMGTPQDLQQNPTLGRLLLIGLVSATEAYFRGIVVGALRVCRFCRAASARHMIPFGSVDYYTAETLGLGLFEHVSFADASEIRKRTEGFLGIGIKENSSVFGALRQFDRLCELRHASAHADGMLFHGNIVELGLRDFTGLQSVAVSFAALQSSAAICYNTVRAYNRHVYRSMVERWIAQDQFVGSWAEDRPNYSQVFNLFHCRADAAGPGNAYHAYRTLPLPT